VVERGVDSMTFEDGEAEAAQRTTELDGEGLLVGLVAVEDAAEVAGGDAGLLVERLGVVRLREVVLLPLLDLVVPADLLVRCLDALSRAVAHGASPGAQPTVGGQVLAPASHGVNVLGSAQAARSPRGPGDQASRSGRTDPEPAPAHRSVPAWPWWDP